MRPASAALKSVSRTAMGKRTLASRKTRKLAGNTRHSFLGARAKPSALAEVIASLFAGLRESTQPLCAFLVSLLLVAQQVRSANAPMLVELGVRQLPCLKQVD